MSLKRTEVLIVKFSCCVSCSAEVQEPAPLKCRSLLRWSAGACSAVVQEPAPLHSGVDELLRVGFDWECCLLRCIAWVSRIGIEIGTSLKSLEKNTISYIIWSSINIYIVLYLTNVRFTVHKDYSRRDY